MEVLSACGYVTEITFPHWLAKAWADDKFVDVIFDSANGSRPSTMRGSSTP